MAGSKPLSVLLCALAGPEVRWEERESENVSVCMWGGQTTVPFRLPIRIPLISPLGLRWSGRGQTSDNELGDPVFEKTLLLLSEWLKVSHNDCG